MEHLQEHGCIFFSSIHIVIDIVNLLHRWLITAMCVQGEGTISCSTLACSYVKAQPSFYALRVYAVQIFYLKVRRTHSVLIPVLEKLLLAIALARKVVISRSKKWQRAKLTGLGPGGLGPPACLATIIWSTERTVRAASVASLMAHCFVTSRSRMFSFSASSVPEPSLFYK